MRAARLHRNFTRRQGLQVACFGTEGKANFAGDSVPAGRMLDTAAGGAKCIASRVSFEVNTEQPWVHGQLPFPDRADRIYVNAYPVSNNCQELNKLQVKVKMIIPRIYRSRPLHRHIPFSNPCRLRSKISKWWKLVASCDGCARRLDDGATSHASP